MHMKLSCRIISWCFSGLVEQKTEICNRCLTASSVFELQNVAIESRASSMAGESVRSSRALRSLLSSTALMVSCSASLLSFGFYVAGGSCTLNEVALLRRWPPIYPCVKNQTQARLKLHSFSIVL